MKKSKEKMLIFITFLIHLHCCNAILSADPYNDISNNRQFGCSWAGGSSAALHCTCEDYAEEFYIEKDTIRSFTITEINIHKCPRVKFGPQSIEDMRNLRSINLQNINSLEFEENSLLWHSYRHEDPTYDRPYDFSIPSLKISIRNSNITSIGHNTFTGRISQINIDSCKINQMQSFAFTTFQSESVTITNSVLAGVAPQTFKKFVTDHLLLRNVSINFLPSRAFNDVNVLGTFIIDQCNLTTLRPGAFIIFNPQTVQILNTRINQLDGEAFKITTNGDVLFRKNIFQNVNDGAFRSIQPSDPTKTNAQLRFDSNVFGNLTRDSLGTSDNFDKKFAQMDINTECDCIRIEHNIKEKSLYTQFRCKFNDEYVNVSEFVQYNCSIIASYSIPIIIISVVVFLVVLIVTGLLVYYKKVHRSKTYGNTDEKKTNLSLIVPDGRTYRETELHVIVERTDLLTTDL